jgi:hypothetical protein
MSIYYDTGNIRDSLKYSSDEDDDGVIFAGFDFPGFLFIGAKTAVPTLYKRIQRRNFGRLAALSAWCS